MKKLYRQLERWRNQRKGRERIPETLWPAAGELARKHGINQVSRVLRGDFPRPAPAALLRASRTRPTDDAPTSPSNSPERVLNTIGAVFSPKVRFT
jgi:hypothetical protein